MDQLRPYFPSGEHGYLPHYLLLFGVVAVGNSLQNLLTLHYTRRVYNGLFVPDPVLSRAPRTAEFNPEDSVNKLVVASSTGKDVEKARDQVTPLAARLFGVWTMMQGLIRIYTAFDVQNRGLYQLAILTHAVAALHFTSEMLAFKTARLTGPQLFPLGAAYGGLAWMILQYPHYVKL